MDLSKIEAKPLPMPSLNKSNIVIVKNHGLNESSSYWWLKFTFDYQLEKAIAVRLTNFKYDSTGKTWTLEIEKCHYLSIKNADDLVSFDMEDELVNSSELKRLQLCAFNDEKLKGYLETNVVPLITKKIKYTKFVPQFRFFLSHKNEDKPLMRTFKAGLTFLGYSTWLDKPDLPIPAYLSLALKTSIDDCDCFIAWLNKEYLESKYCIAELLYAKDRGKIIIPFGVFSEIKARIREDKKLKFLEGFVIINPNEMSFFEVLRRIDETLFNFEKMALPSFEPASNE